MVFNTYVCYVCTSFGEIWINLGNIWIELKKLLDMSPHGLDFLRKPVIKIIFTLNIKLLHSCRKPTYQILWNICYCHWVLKSQGCKENIVSRKIKINPKIIILIYPIGKDLPYLVQHLYKRFLVSLCYCGSCGQRSDRPGHGLRQRFLIVTSD